MMVIDLMHEFELGVWTALLTHLIQILHVASDQPGVLTDILNTRCAQLKQKGSCTHTVQLDFTRFPHLVNSQYNVFTTTFQK